MTKMDNFELKKKTKKTKKNLKKKSMATRKNMRSYPRHEDLFNLLEKSNLEQVDLPNFNENVDTTSPNLSQCKVLTEKMFFNSYYIHLQCWYLVNVHLKAEKEMDEKITKKSDEFINNLNLILINKQQSLTPKTWSETVWSWLGY